MCASALPASYQKTKPQSRNLYASELNIRQRGLMFSERHTTAIKSTASSHLYFLSTSFSLAYLKSITCQTMCEFVLRALISENHKGYKQALHVLRWSGCGYIKCDTWSLSFLTYRALSSLPKPWQRLIMCESAFLAFLPEISGSAATCCRPLLRGTERLWSHQTHGAVSDRHATNI